MNTTLDSHRQSATLVDVEPMRRPHPNIATVTLATLLLSTTGFVATAHGQSTTTTTATPSSSSTTTTTIPPVLRCKNRLLSRAKKLTRRLSRCGVLAVKRAKKGKPFDETACTARAVERYDLTTSGSPKFSRGCLPCTLDAAAPVRDGLVAVATDLDARIRCASGVPIVERARCEIRLRKAVTTYQGALLACRKDAARLAFAGDSPDESSCADTARTRFETKAARLACPACVDVDRIAAVAFEDTDDVITLAQCPCRFGDPSACSECRACDLSDGCVPADQGAACGRNGCTVETCDAGTCVRGETIACSDGDVCTVDVCLEDEDKSCQGTDCCVNRPLCDPATLGACVTECTCEPTSGCSCRCEPGCGYAGCVIFTSP